MSRVLLVTGASGIGEAAARLARERGWQVFTAARESADYCCDLNEDADGAFAAALNHCGQIDALFNVAGISGRRYGDGPLHECTAEGWDLTMDHNARTTFLMCRAALRHWLERKAPGAIVNMASVLAYSPEPLHFASHAYAASKGAIIALTKAMAAYYAPHGIRVNAVAPGLVRTPMSARAQADPDIVEYIRARQPLSGGVIEAEEIARAVLFLVDGESRHITGQILAVDGGWG